MRETSDHFSQQYHIRRGTRTIPNNETTVSPTKRVFTLARNDDVEANEMHGTKKTTPKKSVLVVTSRNRRNTLKDKHQANSCPVSTSPTYTTMTTTTSSSSSEEEELQSISGVESSSNDIVQTRQQQEDYFRQPPPPPPPPPLLPLQRYIHRKYTEESIREAPTLHPEINKEDAKNLKTQHRYHNHYPAEIIRSLASCTMLTTKQENDVPKRFQQPNPPPPPPPPRTSEQGKNCRSSTTSSSTSMVTQSCTCRKNVNVNTLEEENEDKLNRNLSILCFTSSTNNDCSCTSDSRSHCSVPASLPQQHLVPANHDEKPSTSFQQNHRVQPFVQQQKYDDPNNNTRQSILSSSNKFADNKYKKDTAVEAGRSRINTVVEDISIKIESMEIEPIPSSNTHKTFESWKNRFLWITEPPQQHPDDSYYFRHDNDPQLLNRTNDPSQKNKEELQPNKPLLSPFSLFALISQQRNYSCSAVNNESRSCETQDKEYNGDGSWFQGFLESTYFGGQMDATDNDANATAINATTPSSSHIMKKVPRYPASLPADSETAAERFAGTIAMARGVKDKTSLDDVLLREEVMIVGAHSYKSQHQRSCDNYINERIDSDSLADFDESEWTPPDSSYGAAIPFGGWIPKPIRRTIEYTIIGLVIAFLVYVIVATSIRVNDERNRYHNSTMTTTTTTTNTETHYFYSDGSVQEDYINGCLDLDDDNYIVSDDYKCNDYYASTGSTTTTTDSNSSFSN